MIEKGLTKNNGMSVKNTCHAVKKQLTWQTKPKTWLTRSNDLFNQNTWTNKSPGNETGEKIDKAVKIIWHVEPTSGLYNNNPWCLTIQMTRLTPTIRQGCHKEMTGLTKSIDKAVNTRQIVVNTQSECRQELTRLTHAKIMSDKTNDMSDTQSPCLSK